MSALGHAVPGRGAFGSRVPGPITYAGGAAGTPAGAATTGIWNSADKSANVSLSGSDRVATVTTANGAVRGTVSFDGAADAVYVEVVITNVGPAANSYWKLGFGNASVSLASLSGGIYAVPQGYLLSAYEAGLMVVANPAVNGGPAVVSPTPSLMGVADGDTIQFVIANGYLWVGVNGSLSGLTEAQLASGEGAVISGMTGTLFLYLYLDGSDADDPVFAIPTVTAFAAPPTCEVY